MDEELSKVFDNFIMDATESSPEGLGRDSSSTALATPRDSQKNGQLTRKEFHPRASVLTYVMLFPICTCPFLNSTGAITQNFGIFPFICRDLFEIPHIQTIQYVFVAILILFGIQTILQVGRVWFISRIVSWLIDCSIDPLIDWLFDPLIDWLFDWLIENDSRACLV